MVQDGAFSHKRYYVTLCLGDPKSQTASKSPYWFKSYGNFAEWVDLAFCWNFIGGGSAMNGATLSSLFIFISNSQ